MTGTENPRRSMPTVSVITVNYHSLDDIEACLESVCRFEPGRFNLEFIVVSNSPEPDLALEQLRRHYDRVRWISMPENLGFAKANNAGARVAEGEWFFFLNPDTRLLNDAIAELLDTAVKHPESAVIGPATRDEHGRTYPSVKRDVTFARLLYTALPFLPGTESIGPIARESAGPVDVVNGSAMLVERQAFWEAGGMNEHYFMYWEENDLCLRVRQNDRQVRFAPSARITHIGGTTTRRRFLPMEIEKHRSQKKFLKQHYPQLVSINRIIGVIAYSWRTAAGLLALRFPKVRQFGNLWWWYLTKYK